MAPRSFPFLLSSAHLSVTQGCFPAFFGRFGGQPREGYSLGNPRPVNGVPRVSAS
jgi:hypothetical protein